MNHMNTIHNKFLSIIIKKICYAMHFLLMIGVYHQTDDENMIVNPLSLSTKPSHQIDWKILKSRQSHAEDYIGWHGKVSTISFHQFFLNNCYFCKMDSCGEGCKLHDDVLCTQSLKEISVKTYLNRGFTFRMCFNGTFT